ncbi:MAG: MlaD family protein [Candidatus Omnitrophota bacterium]|nr:MlaD family protein [Candidatus Omnitrophota bacterium]
MDYFKPEVKAGIMIVICFTILFVLVFYVGGLHILEKRYPIKVRFNFTGGLDNSAPVRFAGVKVGEVKDIRLLNKEDANIELTLMLKPVARIHRDSQAYINTMGFMGEKYVELTPGSKDSPVLVPGDTIVGTDPIQMDELLKKGKKIADEIEVAAVSLQKFLNDADDLIVANREDVRKIIVNLKEATGHAKEFARIIEEDPWKIMWKGKKSKKDKTDEKGTKNEPRKKKSFFRKRGR